MSTTAKLTRGAFFWLAVLGLLIVTTPSESNSENLGALVVLKFLALALSVPHLFNFRATSVPLGVIFYTLIIAAFFILSNLAMPGNWALAVAVLGPLTMMFCVFTVNQKKLLTVIDAVLSINFAGLALQLLFYMWTGEIVHLHTLLFPLSASRAGEFLGFMRLGGIHLEPGTYANFMYLLVVFRILLGGALTDVLSLLMFVSFALTFSLWGFAAFVTGMIAVALSAFSNQRRGGKALMSLFILISGLLVVLFATNLLEPVFSYVQVRLDPTEGSASYRRIAYDELVATFDLYVPLGMPMAEKFCASCQSPQDLGIWSQIIVRLGIFAAILILVTSLISAWKHSAITFILVLFGFTGKYDLSTPITWLFLALVLVPSYRQPRFCTAEGKSTWKVSGNPPRG